MQAPDASVCAAIRRILIEDLRVSPESLDAMDGATPLFGRGVGLDSIEAMALASRLEQEYAIEFADDDLTAEAFEDLNSLVELVMRVRDR